MATNISIKLCPMHMPEDWQPDVPGFTAKLPESAEAVVVYVGIQNPTSESLANLNATLERSPIEIHDLARFTDRAGIINHVLIAYFSSSQQYAEWESTSGFADWWVAGKHLNADYGLWMERYAFAPGQFETLFSTPDSPEGVCRQVNETIGPILEHGYPGGAEDRIPNSAVGQMQTPFDTMPQPELRDTKGCRFIVQGPKNLCLIRSGQDLTAVTGDELQTYETTIEPALARGLAFLADNADTGCFESRYMKHCDASGTNISKTFGMQVFLSISHLMAWAKSHPTHDDIFNSFQAMALEKQGQFDLRLWHEVAVMGEGDSYAEYVNCHPRTGLLPFTHALKVTQS